MGEYASVDTASCDNRAHQDCTGKQSERRCTRTRREHVPIHPDQRSEGIIGDDGFRSVDEPVRSEESGGTMPSTAEKMFTTNAMSARAVDQLGYRRGR